MATGISWWNHRHGTRESVRAPPVGTAHMASAPAELQTPGVTGPIPGSPPRVSQPGGWALVPVYSEPVLTRRGVRRSIRGFPGSSRAARGRGRARRAAPATTVVTEVLRKLDPAAHLADVQNICPVCQQSLSDPAVLFEDDVWLHARCWRPLRTFLEQTVERERVQD